MLQRCAHQAVGIAVELADHEVHTCKSLADACNISMPYTEILIARMRKAGLLVGKRGPGGGYQLSKPAQHITLSEVVLAVASVPDTNCQFSKKLHEFLDMTNLNSLIPGGADEA